MATDELDDQRYLRALVALLAADRDERSSSTGGQRSELVLADAGLSAKEISMMTGKNYEGVRTTLRRAKK